ncbi:MAG: hypothetical protein ACRCVT_14395 [Leadbetterella sp.]
MIAKCYTNPFMGILLVLVIGFLSCNSTKKSDIYKLQKIDLDSATIYSKNPYRFSLLGEENTFLKITEDSVFLLSDLNYFQDGSKKHFSGDTYIYNFRDLGKYEFKEEVTQQESKEGKFLSLEGTSLKGEKIRMLFSTDSDFENEYFNIFGINENKWRKKKTKKMSNKEIIETIIGNLTYSMKYFEMTNKSKKETFTTQHLASPFKFYSNAIELDRTSEFGLLFANPEDKDRAMQILSDAITSLDKMPSGATYTEQYAKAIANMIQWIRIKSKFNQKNF